MVMRTESWNRKLRIFAKPGTRGLYHQRPPGSRDGRSAGDAERLATFARLEEHSLATPAGSVEDLAAATIRDLGLQAELPRVRPPFDLSLPIPDVVLWIAVAALLAVVLYSLRDFWWQGGRPRGEFALRPEGLAERGSAHLERAEHFAAQGAFVEAMHELLLEAVRRLSARAGHRMAASLTSREVLVAAALPAPAQSALRQIVLRVEWAYFGEHAATRADYQACRDSFDALRSVFEARARTPE